MSESQKTYSNNSQIPWTDIQEYLQTSQKSKYFIEWLNKNEQNTQILEEIEDVWHISGVLPEYFEPNENKAWKKISTEIDRSNVKWYRYISTAAAVSAIIIAVYLYTFREVEKQYTKVITPLGQKTQVLLPDSSLIWLNGGSQIQYPTTFSKKNRELNITGEAHCFIHEDSEHPFVVHCDQLQIIVKGTQFNVKNYPEDHETEIALLNGKIELQLPRTHRIKVKPGELATWNRKENKLNIKRGKIYELSSWINNELIIKNKTFEELVINLERWYGVDIQLDPIFNGKIHQFNFKIKTESLKEILERMRIMVKFDYTINGKNVKIMKPKKESL